MSLEQTIQYGVIAVVAGGFLTTVAQTFINYQSQQNVQNTISQGVQAIVGAGTMDTVDRNLERGSRRNGDGEDGSGGN